MSATGYALGIDVGTTATAAAVQRAANATTFLLGSRGATIPSLVFLRDDQALLTGEAAERRGVVEPTRLARTVRRHLGDSAPIVLGHVPYSAERLLAALYQEVVAAVTARAGAEPTHVAVTHPANWGPAKVELLRHALDLAGLPGATLLTEPVAAAVHHATRRPVGPDATIAVYDLGGGTFDAAVLRRTGTTFTLLGEPGGIERMGGVDFDEAVFAHVRTVLDGRMDRLDGADPSVPVALDRLRRECVGAKEALSADAETTIPVALPDIHTEIRLTRAELEMLLRPAIAATVEALGRAVERAGVGPGDLDAVLLVGGSSHIPLVAQMVASALDRPVAIDGHPKHSVALGAAVVAATVLSASISPSPSPPTSDPPAGGGGARGGAGRAAEAPALPGQVLRHALVPPDSVHDDPAAPTGHLAGAGRRRRFALGRRRDHTI